MVSIRSLRIALAILSSASIHAAATHPGLCEPLAASYLTRQAPRTETDDYVRAAVCRAALPVQLAVERRGIDTKYTVAGTPLSALWHSDAAVASAAFAAVCPIVPPTTPAPDIVALIRREKVASVTDALNECVVKSYSTSPMVCDAFSDGLNTSLSLHRAGGGAGKSITTLRVGGMLVPGLSLPISLPASGGVILPLAANWTPGKRIEVGLNDGSTCAIDRLGSADAVSVRIGAYGEGLTCPPAAVFDLSDTRGDDCGSDHKYRSRTFALPTSLRIKPGMTASSARYTSNCPDGASHIDTVVTDPSTQSVTANYHLKGCGMQKLEVTIGFIKLFAEWCKGRAWLGERIILPIVALSGKKVLEPETSSFDTDEWNWAHLSHFSTLMAEDFALTGYAWQATITYATRVAPGPTRVATLNPGSPIYVDQQEERCFVAFFSQNDGGLFLLSPRTIAECKDSEYGSKYQEILRVGDPCSKRGENGLPTTPDLGKCSQRCE